MAKDTTPPYDFNAMRQALESRSANKYARVDALFREVSVQAVQRGNFELEAQVQTELTRQRYSLEGYFGKNLEETVARHQSQHFHEAGNKYVRARNPLKAAEMFSKAGDHELAIQHFMAVGTNEAKLEAAQEMLEHWIEPLKGLQIYVDLGQWDKVMLYQRKITLELKELDPSKTKMVRECQDFIITKVGLYLVEEIRSVPVRAKWGFPEDVTLLDTLDAPRYQLPISISVYGDNLLRGAENTKDPAVMGFCLRLCEYLGKANQDFGRVYQARAMYFQGLLGLHEEARDYFEKRLGDPKDQGAGVCFDIYSKLLVSTAGIDEAVRRLEPFASINEWGYTYLLDKQHNYQAVAAIEEKKNNPMGFAMALANSVSRAK